jgi:protein SCO1/2
LKGKVVSVDKDLRTASVAHEEIPGFMEAMTMSFIVKDDWAMGVLAPGQSISATLVVDGVDSWIEGIVIQEAPSPGSTPSPPAEPQPGVEVPDFKLRNQDGASIGLHGYRGRYLLLTFIYTRCPLPDYCPRMSANFARIHQAVLKEPALRGKAHLLTVSFDPAVDTPEVLTKYGRERAGDRGEETFSSWEFATGTPEEVKAITGYFGLTYYAEKNQIVHSLRTALIGPDGKLVKVYRGNEWTPEEVVGELRRLPFRGDR